MKKQQQQSQDRINVDHNNSNRYIDFQIWLDRLQMLGVVKEK